MVQVGILTSFAYEDMYFTGHIIINVPRTPLDHMAGDHHNK